MSVGAKGAAFRRRVDVARERELAFFDRRIEMQPVPRDYANLMINNQCSEGGRIAPITRPSMHYHNLKRDSLLRRLLRINALTAALLPLSPLCYRFPTFCSCSVLPLIFQATNNSQCISFLHLPIKKIRFDPLSPDRRLESPLHG